MLFLTHLLGGILAAVYFSEVFGITASLQFILTAAVFSTFPDIDMVNSKSGRLLRPFSNILSFVFRHRGFLHSFAFAAGVYFGMRYLFSPTLAAAAAIGYSSHLLLDAVTKEGIMPFRPLSKARVKGAIRTGKLAEHLLIALFAAALLLRLA